MTPRRCSDRGGGRGCGAVSSKTNEVRPPGGWLQVAAKEIADKKNIVNALDIQTTLGTGTFGRVRLCSLKESARSSLRVRRVQAA